ncbi:MAG: DUF4886 domain-containing protein [Clostridia bacterium]|nr:DUF4886 domain-containing protein [Clostridia bacterium]
MSTTIQSLKILCIGNSFSQDTLAYAYGVAKSLGVNEVKLANMCIGGCTLQQHAENAKNDLPAYSFELNENDEWTETPNFKLSTALYADKWDYVSIQQASGFSGLKESFEGHIDYLIAYIRERVPKETKIVWNMTWAYQQNSPHEHFAFYSNSQTTMYRSIIQTVRDVVLKRPEISIVVPVGTAIQNARTSSLGNSLTRDSFHLSLGTGRFIAALTFIHKITGIELSGVAFNGINISPKEKEIAVECAANAVITPFEVTPSNF